MTPYLSVVALVYLQAWGDLRTGWEMSEPLGAFAPFRQLPTELPQAWLGRSAAAYAGRLTALTGVLVCVAIPSMAGRRASLRTLATDHLDVAVVPGPPTSGGGPGVR